MFSKNCSSLLTRPLLWSWRTLCPDAQAKVTKRLFSAACEAPIEAHKDNFDLHHWVFNLSDSDYQNTARGHIAAGASTHIDGTRTSVNVESVGGNLLVQHYVAEVGEKDYVRMVS